MDPLLTHIAGWPRYVFDHFVVRVMPNRHRLLVRTLVGGAPAVSHAFESFPRQHVLGVIAGDDSVLAICRTEETAERIAEVLRTRGPEPEPLGRGARA